MNAIQDEMLEECLSADHGLTPRELDFIDDLDRHWRDKVLSDKQIAWHELHEPEAFVAFFCDGHRCTPDDTPNRIEFEYV